MVRLYNQTSKHLSWTMAAVAYTCAPFDHVEVPAEMVGACKSRQLPLESTPVAPETKAKTAVSEEQAAARNDKIRLLQIEVDDAMAIAESNKRTADNLQVQLSEANGKITKLSLDLDKTKDRLRLVEADKEGLEAQLKETATKLQFAEDFMAKSKVDKLAAAEKADAAAASAGKSSQPVQKAKS